MYTGRFSRMGVGVGPSQRDKRENADAGMTGGPRLTEFRELPYLNAADYAGTYTPRSSLSSALPRPRASPKHAGDTGSVMSSQQRGCQITRHTTETAACRKVRLIHWAFPASEGASEAKR